VATVSRTLAQLTARQLEGLACMVTGLSFQETAARMGLRDESCRRLMLDARRRLDFTTTTAMVAWAATFVPRRRRTDYYVARFRPLPEHRRGHSPECGCSVCFVHGRQDRRQVA
jgi:DNA-binding CsgD family transcriptional regulator